MTGMRKSYLRPTPTLTRDRDDYPPGLCVGDWLPFEAVIDIDGRNPAQRDYAIAAAKAICDACPLTGLDGPCLRENRDAPGVVAGLTLMQRKKLTERKPCGTAAAANRHRKNGEPICTPCRLAENAAQAERKKRRREREAAA